MGFFPKDFQSSFRRRIMLVFKITKNSPRLTDLSASNCDVGSGWGLAG